MFDLLGNVKLLFQTEPTVIKNPENKQSTSHTSYIYPLALLPAFSLFLQIFCTVPLHPSFGLFYLEWQKSHKVLRIILTKQSPLGLKIQPQYPCCASSVYPVTHIDTGKYFWAFCPRSYDATLGSISKEDTPTSKRPCKTLFSSAPQFHLLRHKSPTASLYSSQARHWFSCLPKIIPSLSSF